MLQKFLTAVLLLTSLATLAAAEEAQQATQFPDVHPGDRWVYQVTDDITGDKKPELTFVVTECTADKIFARVTKSNGPGNDFTTFDREWDLISNDLWRKIPNDASGFKLPLSVGKEWRFKNQEQNLKTGSIFNLTGTSKTLASEKVATKAGTFDTFKVVMEVERVAVADPSRRVEYTLTSWYAPAVKRYVKRTVVQKQSGHVRDSTTQELTQYTLK
ncbi:MAG: hypothetical protein J0I81_03045 [Hyphomicrobium sp.]|nr:hypothetical protein [Hyphomicrobium sp.]